MLAGRKAEEVIKRLTVVCEVRKLQLGYSTERDLNDARVLLLGQCLFDEVQVTPATLRAALRQTARHGREALAKGFVVNLRRGKFGELFAEVAEEAYFGNGPGWEEYDSAMVALAIEAVFQGQQTQLSPEVAEALARSLTSGERVEQARAAFVCMFLAYDNMHREGSTEGHHSLAERFLPLRDSLGNLLSPDDPPLALAAAWALAWMGMERLPGTPPEPDVIVCLFRLWRDAESSELTRFGAWAFSTQPLLARDTFDADVWGDCDPWFDQTAAKADVDSAGGIAPLVLAWYRRTPWNDSELAEKLSKLETHLRSHLFGRTTGEMLATLGEPGRRVLEEWEEEERPR